MKNSFERQVESLIQQRFRERDRCFDGRLVEVMQEYNGRGILRSSIAVDAMHAELEREFEESAAGCVKAAMDAMTSRPTALPLPRKRKVLRVCSDILTRRKAALEAIFQGRTRSILASLSNSGLTAPYRSLSKSFVQLQCENACVELRAKHSELFWLKLNRIQKLFPLLKLRPLVFVVAMVGLYFGRFEIAEAWKDLHSRIVAAVQDSGGQLREDRRNGH